MNKREQIKESLRVCGLNTDYERCCDCMYDDADCCNCQCELMLEAYKTLDAQEKEIKDLTHRHYNECGQIAKYSDELHTLKKSRRKSEAGKYLSGLLDGMLLYSSVMLIALSIRKIILRKSK